MNNQRITTYCSISACKNIKKIEYASVLSDIYVRRLFLPYRLTLTELVAKYSAKRIEVV